MLETYLLQQYSNSKWKYFGHIEILIYFKKNFDVNIQPEIDKLIEEKKIRYRPSFNGQLIELGRRLIGE